MYWKRQESNKYQGTSKLFCWYPGRVDSVSLESARADKLLGGFIFQVVLFFIPQFLKIHIDSAGRAFYSVVL